MLVSAIILSDVPALLMPAGLADLQRFYSEIKSYSASFEQVVVDENLKLLEASNGEFSIERPGKFRWHYTTHLSS